MATGKVKTMFEDSSMRNAVFPRTKTSAISDDSNRSLDVILSEKANVSQLQSPMTTIRITPSSWSSGTYTLYDSRITATSNQEFLPPVWYSGSESIFEAISEANLVDAGQGSGWAKIHCLGTVPSITIQMRVVFRGDK